ncbi:unnamed protein product [Discula destructiva]
MFVKQVVLAVLASTSLTVLALTEQMNGNVQDMNVARDELVARKSDYMDAVPRAVEIDERHSIEARRGGSKKNTKVTKSQTKTNSKTQSKTDTQKSDTQTKSETQTKSDTSSAAEPTKTSATTTTSSAETKSSSVASTSSTAAATSASDSAPASSAASGATSSAAMTSSAEEAPSTAASLATTTTDDGAVPTSIGDPVTDPTSAGSSNGPDYLSAILPNGIDGPIGQSVYSDIMGSSTTGYAEPTDGPGVDGYDNTGYTYRRRANAQGVPRYVQTTFVTSTTTARF